MATYYVSPDFEISSFQDSSLYQYYNSVNYLTILDDVIETILQNKIKVANSFGDKEIESAVKVQRLCQCYDILIKNNFDDLICDMLNTFNKYDQFAICLVAIINENMNIIQLLAQLNFNFNQKHIFFVRYDNPQQPTNEISFGHRVGCDSIFMYPVYYNKIDIIKYLLQNGIKMDKKTCVNFFNCINNRDISLFDDFYNLCQPLDSLDLLIVNISNNNHKIIERLLDMNTGLDVNMIKLSMTGDTNGFRCNGIKLDTLKILINYELVIDNELFQNIFKTVYMDEKVIDFLMTEYSFVPDNELITESLQKIDITKIKLLIKHKVDLSNVTYADKPDEYSEFVDSIKSCNLNVDILLATLLKNKYSHSI